MSRFHSIVLQTKRILSSKKSKRTIYVISVLWIAVIMQVIVNRYMVPKSSLLEAFVNTNSEVSSFELEMIADYGTDYLSEDDRKELVEFIASQIGLKINKEIELVRNGKETERYFEKNSKNAKTLIKVSTVEKENEEGISELRHYIIVKIKLYNNIDSILHYRELLNKTFQELGTKKAETNMQLVSNYKGKLSLDNMNLIADSMIENLNGKVAYANRQEDMFTVYGYTGLLDEYVMSLDTKINIHIAINYDEEKDMTYVYLGTPVINGGY